MRKELDDALCKKFPKIFKDRKGDMRQTAMCWGFMCGDGWYKLIETLCELLMWDESTRKQHKKPPVATQVKEKFGTLRFYVNGANERQHHFIEFAEYMSGKICESCGTMEGIYHTKGWIRTTCQPCDEKLLAARAEEAKSTGT